MDYSIIVSEIIGIFTYILKSESRGTCKSGFKVNSLNRTGTMLYKAVILQILKKKTLKFDSEYRSYGNLGKMYILLSFCVLVSKCLTTSDLATFSRTF